MKRYLRGSKKIKKQDVVKIGSIIIFFSVVIFIYTLANFYIYSRALAAFPSGGINRNIFIICFWGIASMFVLARILERTYPCFFTGVITWIGSFWLVFMIYFLFIVIMIDFARVVNHLVQFFPQFIYKDYQHTKMIILIGSVILVSLIVVIGFINARTPRIKELNLTIAKSVTDEKSLSIVMVSDIHLGTIIAKRKAMRMVNKINDLHPDLVLFAGDIVDEDLAPVIKNDLGASLNRIKTKFGIYAITGNHEYIGGADAAVKYLGEHGIKMLRDTAVLVDSRFYLVGRDDRDKERFTGKMRKNLAEIMKDVDRSFPIILMDHQPFDLNQAVTQGVDLQLSGHTHHGQLWPFNWITNAMYELSWGYLQSGATHFYVSSGFGTWGPPVRLGNRPEIVKITLTFQ